MAGTDAFQILFLGAFTQDTIVSGGTEKVVDGGAFYYGASVAVRMGLRTGAVTRLAARDRGVVVRLQQLGVSLRARETTDSTCLRIEYPSGNPDQRTITVTSTAGSFEPEDLGDWRAATAVVGASFRGEVGEEMLGLLVSRGCRLALDVQGYVRVLRHGVLHREPWDAASRLLPLVSILKADVDEAELLTGTRDLRVAAARLLDGGAAEVLLTSSRAVIAADSGGVAEAPLIPRQVVGRSGRGDTCLAAYAAKRMSEPLAESLVWAAAVTSCKLERDGPFQGTLREAEVRAREIRAAR